MILAPHLPIACLICGILSTALLAQSPLETEVKQLKEKRDKDIAAATQEINGSYQAALELLLIRANEEKNAPAIAAINQALKALSPDAKTPIPASADAPPKVANPELVGDWVLTFRNYMGTRKLNADGSLVCENDGGTSWKVAGNVLFLVYRDGRADRFTLPGFGGNLTGKTPDGKELKLKKVSK